MDYEDARRRAWYAQVEMTSNSLTMNNLKDNTYVPNAMVALSRPTLGASKSANDNADAYEPFDEYQDEEVYGNTEYDDYYISEFQARQESSAEVITAIRWLAVKRPLILCDRKNREYIWFVEASNVGGKKVLTLLWFENVFNDVKKVDELKLSGSIALNDIKDISISAQDPNIFNITLKESPKALKSSGGRAKLSLKCNSAGESAKFTNTLLLISREIAQGNIDHLL